MQIGSGRSGKDNIMTKPAEVDEILQKQCAIEAVSAGTFPIEAVSAGTFPQHAELELPCLLCCSGQTSFKKEKWDRTCPNHSLHRTPRERVVGLARRQSFKGSKQPLQANPEETNGPSPTSTKLRAVFPWRYL